MAISLLSQRIVHNGFDASIRLNDYRTGSYAMTYSSGEYLYIGSFTPFNNMWIEFATASGVSSGAPLIDVRWANAWSSVVDITDETNGMQTSGRITWSLHIDRGWDRERRSQEDAGINGTSIYNMYWMRVSWPSSF